MIDMMHVMVTTMPMRGHVDPMVPIVKELIRAGHEVFWCIHRAFESQLRKLEINVIPTENEFNYSPVDFTLFNFMRAAGDTITQAKHLLVDWCLDEYKELDPVVREYKPDIILTDCVFFASLLLAKKYSIPCAVFGLIPYAGSFEGSVHYGVGWQPATTRIGKIIHQMVNTTIDHLLLEKIYNYAKRRFRDERVYCPLDKGHFYDKVIALSNLYLQGSLKEFEYEMPNIPDKVKFIGPSIRDESEDKRESMPQFNDKSRSLVFVTQGSVQNNPEFLLEPCVEALGDDFNLIIVQSRDGGMIRGGKKGNVIIKEEIPYGIVLPECEVFITNGGFGGVNTALKYGVPMVVAGRSDDKGEVAARVAKSGVGINLRTPKPKPRAIKKAVNKILQDKDYYKRNAMKMQQIINRCNTPQTALTCLESLYKRQSLGVPEL